MSVKGRRGEIEKVLHFELLYFFFYRSLCENFQLCTAISHRRRCDASVFTLGWHWIAIIIVFIGAGPAGTLRVAAEGKRTSERVLPR